MNKNAIKKFAIDARNKLIASVTDKAGMLGITPDNCSEAITKGADFEVYKTAAGTEVTLNKKQCEQRRKLVDQIHARGFEAVVEEVAYTWFNRICAIRFMEVNDYMYPVRVRVLSSEKEGKNEPDVVTMAPEIDWDFTDKEREEYLKKAADRLLSAVNSVYTDLTTSTKHMLKLTRFPIFQKKDQIQVYIDFLLEDIQVATKFVGLRMQVLDYLGDTDGAQIEMSRYQRVMKDFFTKALPNRRYSAAALIHLNYPYNAENRDCWYQLSEDLKPALELKQDKKKEHIYLVSVEEKEDGGE